MSVSTGSQITASDFSFLSNGSTGQILIKKNGQSTPTWGTVSGPIPDTSSATATNSQILSGKTGWSKGIQRTGSIANSTISLNNNTLTLSQGYSSETTRTIPSVTSLNNISLTFNSSTCQLIATNTQSNSGYISSTITKTGTYTFSNQNATLTTLTPDGTKTISAGTYVKNKITIPADPNFIASNIKSGVKVCDSITGTYTGGATGAQDVLEGYNLYCLIKWNGANANQKTYVYSTINPHDSIYGLSGGAKMWYTTYQNNVTYYQPSDSDYWINMITTIYPTSSSTYLYINCLKNNLIILPIFYRATASASSNWSESTPTASITSGAGSKLKYIRTFSRTTTGGYSGGAGGLLYVFQILDNGGIITIT